MLNTLVKFGRNNQLVIHHFSMVSLLTYHTTSNSGFLAIVAKHEMEFNKETSYNIIAVSTTIKLRICCICCNRSVSGINVPLIIKF